MIRWGILGTAKIAREALVPAIQASENGILKAIASRRPESAASFAERYDVDLTFDSYEALLASNDVDAIYIPLPTSQHIEWSLKALEAGKHVLCEKPIALKASQIDQLIEARDRTGKQISEAFMVTYHPQWHKVRQLLASGAIGTLHQVQGSFAYHLVDPDNMRNQVSLGGGGLLDIGVYPTVTTRFVTGKEPIRVQASIRRDPEFGTDIAANCRLDFDDFELSFYCATQMAARQSMIFHGDKGWIELTAPFNANAYDSADVILHDQGNGGEQIWKFRKVDQYQLQVEAFAEQTAGKESEIFSLENSKANQSAVDALFAAEHIDGWVQV
ncbi:Gfo/Idh/MocA family protein [Cohaesibacter gelatinilyticus]|uniref:Predicted dehydrogenase n=1 Tax=Cohaesibacter gelatinilyticus TaxID=372072 RepID=A0A285NAR8_9HYPH|nr:Gfo/Idh/MocA family oxidoreductase [Cohaesibacter gelatinilyticus]SNZ06530.1 Predicted dehydrogenase [Cohaesibacter gelatinilyticus]